MELDRAVELGPKDRDIADLLAMDGAEEIELEIPVRRELARGAELE